MHVSSTFHSMTSLYIYNSRRGNSYTLPLVVNNVHWCTLVLLLSEFDCSKPQLVTPIQMAHWIYYISLCTHHFNKFQSNVNYSQFGLFYSISIVFIDLARSFIRICHKMVTSWSQVSIRLSEQHRQTCSYRMVSYILIYSDVVHWPHTRSNWNVAPFQLNKLR